MSTTLSPTAALPTVRPRRRRIWLWLFLGCCVAPLLVLTAVVASLVTLDRPAALLRDEVQSSTNVSWQTRVQLSVGRITVGVLRAGLAFVPDPKVHEARAALASVRSASVGVYHLACQASPELRGDWMQQADRRMASRGWTRLVGVADRGEKVLVYTPAGEEAGQRFAVAVLQRRELIVVSAAIDAGRLADFLAQHVKGKLPLPSLRDDST
ncbi:MAG: hypothetical protein HZC55_24900 [Verrucomicrobia bacterium]|nr:hypothetical protein [Verrucomicrobiota bacterium]